MKDLILCLLAGFVLLGVGVHFLIKMNNFKEQDISTDDPDWFEKIEEDTGVEVFYIIGSAASLGFGGLLALGAILEIIKII